MKHLEQGALDPNTIPKHKSGKARIEAPSVKGKACRPHTEALGSSAQMRCVSCRSCKSRVVAKSASRTARTIEILMRIRATLPPRCQRIAL